MRTVSGITFMLEPAWNWVMLTTAAFIGFTLRLTMRCNAITSSAPVTTGSSPW